MLNSMQSEPNRFGANPRSCGIGDSDRVMFGIVGRPNEKVARILFDWHEQLRTPKAPDLEGSDLSAYFDFEAEMLMRGKPVSVVPELLWRETLESLDADELESVARAVVASQVYLRHSVLFDSIEELLQHIADFYFPHYRSLARRAGARGSWQEASIMELARGVALTEITVNLRVDQLKKQTLIPLEMFESVGLLASDFDRLSLGSDERADLIRKVMWKLIVRAKDAIANAAVLGGELESRPGRVFRIWLFRLLEVLVQIERRKFDVWAKPVRLNRVQLFRSGLQALFGRTGLAR